MGLLHDIQAAVIQENTDLGPILLKLRLLAARLGSQPLAEWVKHESEGYPKEVAIPDYRTLSVSYIGNFSGPFGSGVQNAPISPYLIQKFAGEHWVRYDMRESIAAVDDLLTTSTKGGSLSIGSKEPATIVPTRNEDLAIGQQTRGVPKPCSAQAAGDCPVAASRIVEFGFGKSNTGAIATA